MIIGRTASDDGDISYNHGAHDVWLVKTDNTGNMLWERTYGGSLGETGYGILKKNDNAYYILAATNSTDGDISYNPYPNSVSYWIIKIDSVGEIIWERIYGGDTGPDYVQTGIVTDDGGLVAFGFTGSWDGDVSEFFGFYDWWMLKLDSLGNKEWDRSFGSTNADYGMAIIQTTDGGYLLGGSARVMEVGNIQCESYHEDGDAVIIKLDALGNVLWQQCYGGSEDEFVSAFFETESGFLVLANTESADGDVTGFHGFPGLGDYDIWLLEIDFSGNLIWQKCLGGTDSESAKNIFPTQNGGYQIIGNTSSNDGDVSGNHSINERRDIWIVEIDSIGNILKQQCIGGAGGEIVWHGVHKHNDHHFVIAAETQGGPSYDVTCDFFNLGGRPRYWVFEISDSTVGVHEQRQEENRLLIFPNPAGDEINCQLSIVNCQLSMFIYDLYGRKQDEIIIPKGQEQIRIDVSGYPAGVYMAILKDDKEVVARGKFVKTR